MQAAQLAEFDAESPGPSFRTAPGLSSGPAAGSWLQHTREQLQVSQCRRLVLPDPVPVLVLAVQRYLGEGARPAAYCYDVSLWDGVSRDTWLLSPELAQWIHRNRLRCGLWARIGRCSYRFLEKSLSSGLVCIEELELEEGHGAGQDGVTGHGEREDIPLLGGRKHYLPLWNNEDPYGGIWKEGKPAEEQLNVNVSKICSLQHLENIWRCKTALPPLLVRIMHKSRLRFFGKPDKKTDIPYQAYFEVADHSGMMSLVLWNSLCPEWFNTLQVGRVILIQQYAVKKSYSKRTLPTPGNLQVKRLPSLEISLNARDPPASINIIKENLVKPEWRLPSVKYQFVTRADLNDLPHNKVCDVIGLVNFVGRCERKRFSDDSEDFWLYRWIQIIDGTSDIPFLLEIFATSQPEIFEKIHPLSYLVCTQMRVIREDPLDSPGAVFLTTSNESQVFISGHHKGQPYISDRKVRNFISWMKTQNEAEVKKKVMIGGYHPFPLTPATFTKYCNENKVESVLTSFGELRNVIEHLHYREHKRIAIHGVIVALRYVEYNDITRNTPDKEAHSASRRYSAPNDQGGKQPAEESLSDLLLQEAEVVPCLQPKSIGKNPVMKRKRPHELSAVYDEDEDSDFVPRAIELEGSDKESHDSAGNKEVNDVSKSSKDLWESDLWSEVAHSITEHLHYNQVFPGSSPRKFDYTHKDILMQHYNLHPAKCSTTMCHSKNIEEFTSANSIGHCELTILSINQNLAVDVVALPVLCSDNSYVFTMHRVPRTDQIPCPGTSTNNTGWTTHSLFSEGELANFVRAHDRLHVICILDIFYLEENKVEVCLNRIYNPVDEAVPVT